MGDGPNRGTEGRDTEEKDGWPAWKEGNEWSGVEGSGVERRGVEWRSCAYDDRDSTFPRRYFVG